MLSSKVLLPSEFFELGLVSPVRSCEFAANARRFDDAGCRDGSLLWEELA